MSFKLLYSGEDIRAAAQNIANKLTEAISGEKAVIIGVLSGGAFFCTDVAKAMGCEVEVDFVRIKSYDGTCAGDIKLICDVCTDIAGKNVIIIDDIADSGASLEFLAKRYSAAKSITTVTMLKRGKSKFAPDYSAFTLKSDAFVIGYGLDYNGLYRNLDGVYEFEH